MTILTADLCDDHIEKLRVLAPLFQSYGQHVAFHGPVTTLKLFEDNSLVRDALEQPGNGQVLVIDGGGSTRCALVGGNLGVLAEKNGWAGIVVNGCIRDSAEINAQKIGVKALATCPVKSVKKGVGDIDAAVTFAGVTIQPGDYLYSDMDGIVVASELFTSA